MSEKDQPQTMTEPDLLQLRFLQGGQVSPDGRMVVYAVSHIELDEAKTNEAEGEKQVKEKEYVTLWLLSLATGQTRQLTAGLARDTSPQWSPDGHQIAFLSTRGEKPQLYLIPVDGGEAQALTSLPQGVGSGPTWSPDGNYIAFTAGPAKPAFDPKRPYRVTRHIYRFDGMGCLDNAVQDIYIIPAAGGDARQLTADGGHNTIPQWSPDSQEILYQAALAPDSHAAFLGRLRVVSLAGEVRDLTDDWDGILAAGWTPDGERILLCGTPLGKPIGSKHDLWVIGRQGGQPDCRTTDLKAGVGGRLQPDMAALQENQVPKILVSGDSRQAYIRVKEGGTISIYRIALSGPEAWTPVVTGERACYPQNLQDRQLLFAASSFDNPADLFMVDLDSADERQLTQLNADFLAKRRLPTVEPLRFPSKDGVQVEGWVLKPTMGQAPYPTILYIHGGPHSGFGHLFSFDFQMLAGAGYAVLLINQRGSTGYDDAFATQILGDWGNLDYADLMAGVDLVIDQSIADPDRLGCCGLSGGGNLSCWIVGQTDRFKAAVPENPVTNWISFYGTSDIGPWFAVEELGGLPHEIPEVYHRCSPITYAHRCQTPTLLIQGEADYRCPAEQSEQFYTVLKANGCVVEMLRLPESSHAGSIQGDPAIRQAQNQALLAWMNRYVLGVESDGATAN